jgi:hypothetical protein
MEWNTGSAGYSNALDPGKLFILSVLTLSTYQLYWLYRNWSHIKEYSQQPIRPVGRTVAALFPILDIVMFCAQFAAIQKLTKKDGRRSFSLVGACIGYSVFVVIGWALIIFSQAFFDPSLSFALLFVQTLVSVVMAMVLLPVQMTLNDFWLKEQPEKPLRTSYTNGEIAWMVIGGIFLIFSLASLFIPPPLPAFDYPPAGLDDLSSLKTQ